MYDIEKIRKRRMIKIIITDIIIACCVLAVSAILIAVVAGWRVNSNLTVEQNGIVSVHTKPTNAKVYFDDNNEDFLTTNTSKMLSSGKHTVRIEKEGYTSWQKEIEIVPGWLVRLEYPRLYKINRETKEIKDFKNLNFFISSPNRNIAIANENDSNELIVIDDFNAENPNFKSINLENVFPSLKNVSLKNSLKISHWNKDNQKIIASVGDEWGIIDLKNENGTINLSAELKNYKNDENIPLNANIDLSAIKFENDAGDKIIANIDNNLVRIDVTAKNITKALDEKVEKFNSLGSTIIYLTKDSTENRQIKLATLGNNQAITLAKVKQADKAVTFGLTRYNNVSYILYTIENKIKVYRAKDFPTNNQDKASMTKIIDEALDFTPVLTTTSNNNEFIIPRNDQNIAVFDIELEKFHSYNYGDNLVRFLDDCTFYKINKNGELEVWDFDNTNHNTIANDMSSSLFDVFISPNERHLYRIKNTENGAKLVREKLW